MSDKTCAASLGRRASCTFKLTYTGSSEKTISAEELLVVSGNPIKYSAVVIPVPAIPEPVENLSVLPATPDVAIALAQPATVIKTIRFNNSSAVRMAGPITAEVSSPGIVVNSVSCSGGLSGRANCDLTYTVSSNALPAGISSQSIKLKSGIITSTPYLLNLDITANSAACTPADAESNQVNLANSNSVVTGTKTGNDKTQCLLASNSCNQYYSIASDAKSCIAQTLACSPADVALAGWNTTQAATYGGSRVGSNFDACIVATCKSEYLLNNTAKKCDDIACTPDNSVGNGITSLDQVATIVGNIGDDSCRAATCSSSAFQLASDSRSCVGVAGICTETDAFNNGWNVTNASTFKGQKNGLDVTACEVDLCDTNYEINAKDCTPIACTVQNSGIANAATFLGNKAVGCTVDTCAAEYTKAGNTCLGTSCTAANAIGNGLSSIDNVATFLGTISDDSCSVGTCNDYHVASGDNKLCSPKECSAFTETEKTALGYNFTNATVAGSYGACVLTCTSSSQVLAADGKSCEDKTPSGTISFAQNSSRVAAGNVLNIVSTDAESVTLYSDVMCVTQVGLPVTLPALSTLVDIAPVLGEQFYYAQFKNGSKYSSCSGDSIIFDNTPPEFSITSPLPQSTFSGDSLIVQGECTDLYSEPVSIAITLEGINGQTSGSGTCVDGDYSITLNTASLEAADHELTVTMTDALQNSSEYSIIISKVIPQDDEEPEIEGHKLFMFGAVEQFPSQGVEIVSIDSNHEATFEKDLLEFGHGYVAYDYGTSLVKLNDGNIYVVGGVQSPTTSYSTNSSRAVALKINPGETYASEVTEVGYQQGTLYWSTVAQRYMYRTSADSMIKTKTPEGEATNLIASEASFSSGIELNNKTYFMTKTGLTLNLRSINASGTLANEGSITGTTAATIGLSQLVVMKNKIYAVLNINSTGNRIYEFNDATDSFTVITHSTSSMSAVAAMGLPTVAGTGSNQVMGFGCTVTPLTPASQTSQGEFCVYDGVNPFVVYNLNTNTTSLGSSIAGMFAYGNKIIFRAAVTTIAGTQGGTELVVYDPGDYSAPYAAARVVVKDLSTVITNSSAPQNFTIATINNVTQLVFSATLDGTTNALYTWNGVMSPFSIQSLPVPAYGGGVFAVSNNVIYYNYLETSSAYEVAYWDFSTASGKYYNQYVLTGGGTSQPSYRQFIVKDNYVYFQTIQSQQNFAAKVHRLDSLHPTFLPEVANEMNSSQGIGQSSRWMAYLDGKLIFQGNNPSKNNYHSNIGFTELFSYDTGSQSLYNFGYAPAKQDSVTPGTYASGVSVGMTEGVNYNGRVYTSGSMNNNQGSELVEVDGSSGVSFDINPGTLSSSPSQLRVVKIKDSVTQESKDILVFVATNATSGSEVWIKDGNAAPYLLKDINPGTASSSVSNAGFISFRGKLMFAANDGTNGVELWESDGTAAGTNLVADTNPGSANFLSFSSSSVTLKPMISFKSNPNDNNSTKLCFHGVTVATGGELFCYDGTAISVVKDIAAGTLNGVANSQMPLFTMNNKLYFTANTAGNTTAAIRMFSTDGTSSNTVEVSNYTPYFADSNFVQNPLVYNGKAYYNCRIANGSDYELCVFDGTTVTRIELNAAASGNPRSFIKFKNRVYFSRTTEGDIASYLKVYSIDANNVVAPVLIDGKNVTYFIGSGLPHGFAVEPE